MYDNIRFIITITSKYVEKPVLEAEVATSIEAGEATTICELGTLVEEAGGFASMGRATRFQNCTAWAKRPLQLGGGEAGEILSRRWRLSKTNDPPPGLALAPAIAGTSCHTQARASLTPSPVYRGR